MKIRAKLSIGYPSAVQEEILEIPDDILGGLDDAERRVEIDQWVEEWAWNYIEWSWEDESLLG